MKRLKEVKGLVLLAFAVTAGMALLGTAASASGSAGGPLAKSAATATHHIPLSKASGAKPRSLKGVPAKGNYAFLLKLNVQSTGIAYNANLPRGHSAARVAAADQLATVRAAQSRVIAALPSGSHVLYQTHAVLAGVAVYTNVKNVATLQRMSGVSAVYPIAPKKPALSYSVELEHGPQVWQNYGDTGEGSSIAVIDTGVDYTHADFGGPGTKAAYTTALATDTVAPVYPDTNKISDQSFDFAGDAYDATPTDPGFDPTPAPDPNPLDCNSHGTHTAGDAAGYGENPDGSTFSGDYTTLGDLSSSDYQALFKIGPGMAPGAKIYSYKVFGCAGSTNLVGAAIDRAADPNNDGSTADHVDVISMSLGSDYGSPQDGDSVASNDASALGISVVAAAGNGGDLFNVGGSPGNAQKVIGVAASADAYNQIDTIDMSVNSVSKQYGGQHSVAYDWANQPDISGTVVEMSDATNKDGCSPFNPTDAAAVAGKVVFLQWTDDSTVRRCGSAGRSGNAANAGAIGVILGEDQETFTAGITGSAVIPVVQVVKSASDEIQAALDASQPVSVSGSSFNDFKQVVPGNDDTVASFTSRGIRDAGNVKPDVAAVGVSVFSAGMGTGNDGLNDSGTSMATPEVAGLDALVRNVNSGWTPEEVKADIMNTAGQDLFTGQNHGGKTFAPGRVGAGRIDAKAALDNQVLAFVTDDPGAVSASFGTIEATGPLTLHKTIKLENTSGSDEIYNTSYDPLTAVPGASYSVSPSQVEVDAGDTATVTLTLTIDPTQLTKTIDPTVDRLQGGNPRAYVAEASGRVLFKPQDGSVPQLRVPVYSSPRPASVMTQPASIDMPSGSIQSTTLPLSGTGVDQGSAAKGTLVQSLVAGFELQATSGALSSIPSDEKAADLKYVGTTSSAPELASIGDSNAIDDGEMYFAISTQGPWHTAASQNEYDIYIDSNGDGVPDTVTFNTRLTGTDVLVDETIDLNSGTVIDIELLNDVLGNTDTALLDSNTMVMPVWIGALAEEGLTTNASRVTYGVVSFGQFAGSPVDSVGLDSSFNLDGSLTADPLNPGVAVFGTWNGSGTPLLYQDMPGTSLTIRRDAASYTADNGMGAMIVHFQNAVGSKAQIVNLAQHTLTVDKAGTGTGTVTSSPTGIDCGSTCSAAFDSGATVALTATPDSDSSFTGWSGGGCSGTGVCQVTLNADTTVTATFTHNAAPKDTTPPKVKGLKVKVNHKKHTAKVTFKGTDPGHGSSGLHFKCKLDKKSFKSCRSGKVYKHLHSGKHTVQVKAIDKAGNVSKPAKRKFKV